MTRLARPNREKEKKFFTEPSEILGFYEIINPDKLEKILKQINNWKIYSLKRMQSKIPSLCCTVTRAFFMILLTPRVEPKGMA